MVQILSPGAFTQLSLPLSMYIGGVPDFDTVPTQIKVRTSFRGCIQKVCIYSTKILLYYYISYSIHTVINLKNVVKMFYEHDNIYKNSLQQNLLQRKTLYNTKNKDYIDGWFDL